MTVEFLEAAVVAAQALLPAVTKSKVVAGAVPEGQDPSWGTISCPVLLVFILFLRQQRALNGTDNIINGTDIINVNINKDLLIRQKPKSNY